MYIMTFPHPSWQAFNKYLHNIFSSPAYAGL